MIIAHFAETWECACTQQTLIYGLLLPHKIPIFSDASILKVFYNSAYSFSGRLYASLDVDLPHIRLYQPLTELTQQSLIYVKDTLPQKIFR